MHGPYPRDVIDAKLDSLRADVRAVDSVMRSEFSRVDSKIDSLDANLSARIDGLDAKLSARIDGLEGKVDARFDGLRGELKVWFLIFAFIVTPFMSGIGNRAVAALWPPQPPASQHPSTSK